MKIPEEVRKLYTEFDPETEFFLEHFDEPEGRVILEVGAHDAPISQMLAACGHSVVSVDLRDHDYELAANHKHVTGDFVTVELPPCFDVAVSVSAIEHFGLGTYGDPIRPYLDVIACHRVWNLLKPGGVFYCLVPFGAKHVERLPHFRVYDYASLSDRVVQAFRMDWLKARFTEEYFLNGEKIPAGRDAGWYEILSNMYGVPGLAALVKLVK